MKKFIVLTFLLLGWGYYEMSGGADFVPEARIVAEAEPAAPSPSDLDLGAIEIVTRSAPAEATLVSLTEEPEVVPLTEVSSADIAAAVQAVIEEPPAEPVVEAAAPVVDLREVTGDRVNLREGPGRDFAAVDQLTSGERVSVLAADDSGWVQVEVVATGQIGWMSADFLVATGG